MADTFQPIGAVAVNLPIFPRYSGVAYALARYRAKQIVQNELRSQGRRVSLIPPSDIIAQAMEYLSNHPELLDECAETVRNGPKLRTLAEREERERWRKYKKAMRGR
jgi:hypothetical protein